MIERFAMADSILELAHCARCGMNLPKSDFHQDVRYKSGVNSWCRLCLNAYKRERRKPHLKRRKVVDGRVECLECRCWKCVEEFRVNKTNSTGVVPYCRPCETIRQRRWRDRHPQMVKDQQARVKATKSKKKRLARYGLSEDSYKLLFASQCGRCVICMTQDPGARGWQIDHCHKTGKVRGILCVKCNAALGMASDNVDRLRSMIEYLKRWADA